MRYTMLGRTGMKVSVLGCGTNMLSQFSQEQATEALNYALDRGVNLVETGSKTAYGVIEEMVGKAIAHRRDDYWLASKNVALTEKETLRDVEQSLTSLQTDHLDLYELGNIRFQEQLDRVLRPGGALKGLIRCQREGKVNFIGITGHNPDILAKALKAYPFDNVLFIFNMIHPYPLDELLPYAKGHGVGTFVMRPTGHGALKPATRSLRFALCSGADVVLSGMYSKAIIDENIATAEPEPTPEEFQRLLQDARRPGLTGCTECGACACPQGISVPTIMSLIYYRRAYGLQPAAEAMYRQQAERAKNCNDCGECEKRCPYKLTIIPVIHEAAREP
ncbi:MAG: aldo/keto reductase [Candidatus Bathyarchaeia archaeon]